MAQARRFMGWFDRGLADIAGIGLVLMMVMIFGSTLSRFLFHTPVPDVEVLTEMLLVGVVFLSFAHAQALRQHVEVTLFTQNLSVKARHWLGVLGYLIGTIGFSVLGYGLYSGAMRAFETGDAYLGVHMIQTWPARSLAVIGVAAIVLRLVIDLVTAITMKPEDYEDDRPRPDQPDVRSRV